MGKVIKWTFIVLGILIVLLLAAAVLIPVLYKDKIVELVKKEANKQLNATLDFDNDISLSIFKSFPNLSLGMKDVVIVNKAPFAGDTLVAIGQMDATLDIMSVINGGKIDVKEFILDRPNINLKVLKDGTANWDIALADTTVSSDATDTAASEFKMGLEHYEINNANISYIDSSLGMGILARNMTHTGNGDFTQDIFILDTRTAIDSLTFAFDGINYLDKVNTKLDMKLNMDMPNMKFTFKENELDLNDLALGFDGYVAMPADDIEMNMTYAAKKADFKTVLSLIPAIFLHDFEGLKASGKMALDGDVKGIYNETTYPGFNVNLMVENGMFQYPDLPAAVQNVNIDAHVAHPGGDLDRMVINVPTASLSMAGEPVSARLKMTNPMTDPFIDAAVKGKIYLEKLKDVVKLDEGTTLAGLINADLALTGRMSTLENEKYEEFNAKGFLAGQDIKYASADLAQPLNISTMQLDFTPKEVKLSNTNLKLGESDLHAEGNLSNFLGYALKDQTLKGDLTISSNYFNVNPLLGGDTQAPQPEAEQPSEPLEAIELPGNIDFTMKADMKHLIYDNFDITNFKGLLVLRDQKLEMKQLALNMLNGTINVDGYYDSKVPGQPKVDMNLGLKNISIPSAYKTFVTVQQFAPIAKYISGNMDASLSLNTLLDKHMMPVLSSVQSNGVLKIAKMVIEDYLPMKKVTEKLNLSQYNKVTMLGIQPSYYITDGRFFLKDPVKFDIDKIKAEVIGSSGLDKTLDYTMIMDIPAEQLKQKATNAMGDLGDILKRNNVELPIGKTIKVKALIGGTVDNPTVSLDIKDVASNVLDAAKDKAKEMFDQKKKELEDQARQRLDEEKRKAQEELDRRRKEAEDKINAERQRIQDSINRVKKAAEDRIKEEGEKKLKDIFKNR